MKWVASGGSAGSAPPTPDASNCIARIIGRFGSRRNCFPLGFASSCSTHQRRRSSILYCCFERGRIIGIFCGFTRCAYQCQNSHESLPCFPHFPKAYSRWSRFGCGSWLPETAGRGNWVQHWWRSIFWGECWSWWSSGARRTRVARSAPQGFWEWRSACRRRAHT